MPVISTIATVAGIAAAGVGAGTAIKNSATASRAANANIGAEQLNAQIAQQELADKQKIFEQLQPFFSQYLQQGSPYLQNIQRAGAEQNAQQFSNAAGQLRQTMGQSGLGYGPSGTTAAALGQLGGQQATSSANSYLQNLLNNEQVKFQASQGLSGIGNMMSGQNQATQVGATPLPPQNNIGSSIAALGQVLAGLNKPGGGSQPNSAGGTDTQTVPWAPGPVQGYPA